MTRVWPACQLLKPALTGISTAFLIRVCLFNGTLIARKQHPVQLQHDERSGDLVLDIMQLLKHRHTHHHTVKVQQKLHAGSVAQAVSPRRICAAAAGPSDVFVLDFDGVLVDSEPEVSSSAYAAARDYWPDLFSSVNAARQQQVMDGLRSTRPVLVRGYESMVMARMLLENPGCVDAILADWHPLLHKTLDRWGEQWERLQTSFEQHRATWLASDRAGWLARNQPYDGMVDAVAACEHPIYFASSKAAHRVSTLMQEHFSMSDLTPDSPRLFASLLPPEEKKVEALRAIADRPVCRDSGAQLHFVDDRLDTLLAVQQAGLQGWNLYMADWGYNTAAERKQAKATPGIRLLSRLQFLELLKWGMLMGVDDGCEPTAEEVAAGV